MESHHSDEWKSDKPWNNEKDPMWPMVYGTWPPMTYSCSLCHPGSITLYRIYDISQL